MTTQTMQDSLTKYLDELRQGERAAATVGKYRRDIQKFFAWAAQEATQKDTQEGAQDDITKETILAYKEYLTRQYKTASVNSYLIALNKYLAWLGADSLKAHTVKQQQRNSLDNVMSRSDYERLLRYAKKLDKERMYFIMRTLAGTGIRIEELRFITVEAITKGKGSIQVNNKGKLRDIVIAPDLCKELRRYCKEQGITAGIIFHSRSGADLLDKSYIWREMKFIAGRARVNKSKVHAHSFRHLFAKTFMDASGGNVVELADLLGHSSLETTRIYTRSSSKEKRDKISKLGL